jgi:ribonucleoside-diphosphate reductase alpha chain
MPTGRLDLTENARHVLEARYLRRGEAREIVESPEELFARVARGIAEAELASGDGANRGLWEERFHELLTSLDLLPNSPTLMNAGTSLGQLSACFVLPVEDDMEGIFETLKQMALVQRTGGGTGFSFSRLRPRSDLVHSTGGEASGPVSFMRIYDCATENIKQGGRRRGANLGVLRVDHPDILEFVRAKLDGRSFRNFNISVGATDRFFEAVRDDGPHELVHPKTGKVAARLPARELFDAIVDAAFECGDPGLLFLDAIERANPVPRRGRIESANPCGEVPLLPYESCNLASVNLSHMLRGRAVDWERLGRTVELGVRFLDDVIEANRYPVEAIERATRATRKIGLGVMGFAEMLIELGISYDSDKASRVASDLMKFIAERARNASAALADSRGPFPAWDESLLKERGLRLRNATTTAIAPTGTLSILAGTSPGIEPLFALAFRRTGVLSGETLVETSPILERVLSENGVDPRPLLTEVSEKGSLGKVGGVPERLRRLLVTALEIPPARHLEVQAAFQRHVDNSVSKTVNLAEDATREEIAWIYRRAWELGLKGVTVYRFGSKSAQVIELGATERPERYLHGSKCDPEECRL